MTIAPNQYQEKAVSTEIYTNAAVNFITGIAYAAIDVDDATKALKMMYCVGKLNGEAGEAAEIVFKAFRGNEEHLNQDEIVKLAKELGDIQWYVANIAHLIGYKLEDIMQMNVDKLQDRKKRGVIHGHGDER